MNKHPACIVAILGTLAAATLPTRAGEGPSRADMFKSLLVVGVYARLCPAPLSEYTKAQTLTVLRMLGEVDSALLEYSITAYRDRLISEDTGPWCNETAKVLSNPAGGASGLF